MSENAESLSSLESERAVLGILLTEPETLPDVLNTLKADDFSDTRHRVLFQSIQSLWEENAEIDTITVLAHLSDRDQSKAVGGLPYVSELANSVVSAAGIETYVRIVKEKSLLRKVVESARTVLEMAKKPEGRSASEVLENAQGVFFSLSDQLDGLRSNFIDKKQILIDIIKQIESAQKEQSEVRGLPSGFVDLDEKTSGFHPGQLIIVAGRPSMGKTAFAMNIAEYVACEFTVPAKEPDQKNAVPVVAFFSMEMSGQELLLRSLSSISGVPQYRMQKGGMHGEHFARLVDGLGKLSKSQLFIDETPALSPIEMRSRLRKLKKETGRLDLVVIDYLQLMQIPGRGFGSNRVAEISEISRSLKAMAKDLEVPVVALSQLNRGLENRTDKRPQMSDLRESGAIEQDADVILFLYREEVYKKDKEEIKGLAEVIIGKQRNGPIGSVMLTFDGECTRFRNHADENYGNF